MPRRSNRYIKRKRKLPASHYPRFRASDATNIESGNLCATSICAYEFHIRSDIDDNLGPAMSGDKQNHVFRNKTLNSFPKF